MPLVNTRGTMQLDLEGLKQQVGKVKVVFLCSPGNPTGNTLPSEQIQAALTFLKTAAVVVVDEAYMNIPMNVGR